MQVAKWVPSALPFLPSLPFHPDLLPLGEPRDSGAPAHVGNHNDYSHPLPEALSSQPPRPTLFSLEPLRLSGRRMGEENQMPQSQEEAPLPGTPPILPVEAYQGASGWGPFPSSTISPATSPAAQIPSTRSPLPEPRLSYSPSQAAHTSSRALLLSRGWCSAVLPSLSPPSGHLTSLCLSFLTYGTERRIHPLVEQL